MMRSLLRHPESEGGQGLSIEVQVTRPSTDQLVLRYRVAGDMGGLLIPPAADPARTDELWRHTCFEAFLRRGDSSYLEFNLAPSGRWAAYRFDSYRTGMADDPTVPPPRLDRVESTDALEVRAVVGLAAWADQPGTPRLGLSTVIEERSGAISYWALAHAPGKPDFHHPDAFAVDLPPTETS